MRVEFGRRRHVPMPIVSDEATCLHGGRLLVVGSVLGSLVMVIGFNLGRAVSC
jgi:hypothetical protein